MLILQVHGYAQKQGLADSLLKELNSEHYKKKEDTDKVNLLQALSTAYSRLKVDEGIKYGQLSLSLAEKLKWKKGTEGANYCLSTNYLYKGDFKNALKYLLKLKEDVGDKRELLGIYKNIGLSFSELNGFEKSLEYYFKALDKAKELGDKNEMAIISANISICYEDLGDYTNAKEYLVEALKSSNSSSVSSFYENIQQYTIFFSSVTFVIF